MPSYFKKGEINNMKKITEERIDEVIEKIFGEIVEDTPVTYANRCEKYEKVLKNTELGKDGYNLSKAASSLAIMTTLQNNMFLVLKETMKELICDED